MLNVFPCFFSPYFLKQGLSLNMDLMNFTTLASQRLLGICLSPPPQHLDYGCISLYLHLCYCQDLSLAVIFVQQAPYKLRCQGLTSNQQNMARMMEYQFQSQFIYNFVFTRSLFLIFLPSHACVLSLLTRMNQASSRHYMWQETKHGWCSLVRKKPRFSVHQSITKRIQPKAAWVSLEEVQPAELKDDSCSPA